MKIMNKYFSQIIFATMITFLIVSIKHHLNARTINPVQVHSKPIDTLKVLKLLPFSKNDSLRLHIVGHNDSLFYAHEEYLSLDTVSNKVNPFFIRTVISIYPNKSGDYGYFGSYLTLYKPFNNNFHVNRIEKDSIEISLGGLDYCNPEQKVVDINYDGYKDIIISFVQNTTGRNYYNYFNLFDSNSQKFIKDASLDSLFQEEAIYIDENAKEISTGGRIGIMGFSGEDYRWDGKKYKLHAINEIKDIDGAAIQTKKELINGKWMIIESDTTYLEEQSP